MEARTPRSVGILMDGNRRYAAARGLARAEGHWRGMRKVKQVVRWARGMGVEELVLYGFSTENWRRAPEEVAGLMALFEYTFGGAELDELIEEGFRVRVIGQRDRLPPSLARAVARAEELTKDGTRCLIVIALSYGGRAEILDAVNALMASGAKEANEESLRASMWSAGILDPDLIIRTGGDRRLSNFLPWQAIYSELFFTDTKWPELSEEEFRNIVAQYGEREQRRGR